MGVYSWVYSPQDRWCNHYIFSLYHDGWCLLSLSSGLISVQCSQLVVQSACAPAAQSVIPCLGPVCHRWSGERERSGIQEVCAEWRGGCHFCLAYRRRSGSGPAENQRGSAQALLCIHYSPQVSNGKTEVTPQFSKSITHTPSDRANDKRAQEPQEQSL